ncbi:unnamed protein product [Rotaria socialis]|uniref:Uncharacterized protein n=1 Tax=Rotaria socialis TaxID=392032 RepID=A0A821S095_9BILA|nr:unnamed protein product [Rotaria socialis]CAF3521888.1 unnamed protein product [Rotaria socialis]CAF3526917.1 unnamed protein product [Rotaria socialis]CAF4324734.1 unnamed protein product [Rotaria socialis]CAF4489117.1 unnamed protein product [Rotaria socialis]
MQLRFFIVAFGGQGYGTPPAVAFICACFAKTWVISIPMIYAGISTQFHLSIVKHNTLEGLHSANRVAPEQTITLQNQTAIHLNETVKHEKSWQSQLASENINLLIINSCYVLM